MTAQNLPLGSPRSTRILSAGAWLTAVSGVLAATAVTNHLLSKRAERRHPAAGKFIEVDGTRLHYLEKGAGPPVVLLHGNGVSAEDYRISGLFDALALDHRVISFDRPGFGYSDRPRSKVWTAGKQAELIHAALSQLGVEDPVIVGHSWGTLVAANFELERPGYAKALVLMSGYYHSTLRPGAPALSAPAIPGFGDLIRFTLSPILGRLMMPLLIKQMFAPSATAERFDQRYSRSMALRPSQIRASAEDTALMMLEGAKIAKRREELRLPVLVIAGDKDKIVSFEHQSRRLAHELEQSELHAVEGAGHMVHHIAPVEVGEAIRGFSRRSNADPVATGATERGQVASIAAQ